MKLSSHFFLTNIFFMFSIICFAQNGKQPDYIILSGKIENVKTQTNGKKIIELGPPFHLKSEKRKVIQLSPDGSFADTIKSGTGLYNILDQSNHVIPIYLSKSKRYLINYNTADYLSGGIVKLAGADTAINRYFIEKNQKRIFIDRENVERSEDEFRQIIGKIKQDQLQDLNNSKLPKSMKSEEAKWIKYEWLSELYYFLSSKQLSYPDFKPSTASKNELKINYTNEDEYKRQPYYSKLVYLYYEDKLLQSEAKNKGLDSSYSLSQHIIRLYDSLVPNKYIKNDLIEQDASYYLREAIDKEAYYNDFNRYYSGDNTVFKQALYEDYLRFSKLKKGTPSPEFFDYLNFDGGNNSLKDFRGKYVYIDIWASWCGNCWTDMPYIRKMEEDYKGKNIVFISLSVDKFESKWKETIKKQELKGIQLLVKDSKDGFLKNYAVNGIPRYIFLDPNGCIIDYNAPRPSNKTELEELFKSVGL